MKFISDKKGEFKTLIALILAGEVIFFLPFVLVRVFRPTLLEVFQITNLELGTYFSLYGIVAMCSYFLGGPFADRYSTRKLIAISLWLTAMGGLVMSIIPGGITMKWLYSFWGFTTIFLFWSALIKATRIWGSSSYQGKAFGFLEGGRGFTAAIIATFAMIIFSSLMPADDLGITFEQRKEVFQLVLLCTSLITLLTGLLVWFMLPKSGSEIQNHTAIPSFKYVIMLISVPGIWMQAIIIICAYVGYKITDDISLYFREVHGFTEVNAAGMATSALWLRPIFAIVAGIIADRFGGSKIISICFFLMMIGGLIIFLGIPGNLMLLTILIFVSTLAGVYGIRGIYFSVMGHSGIPLAATGTAVGIMSVVGYTPDIFMSPLMGLLLDSNPGEAGHRFVFLTLSLFATVGFVVSVIFQRIGIKA